MCKSLWVIKLSRLHHPTPSQQQTSARASVGTLDVHTRAAMYSQLSWAWASRELCYAGSQQQQCLGAWAPLSTWDWLLPTLGEGPALSVSIGLRGHSEAKSSVRISCDCWPGWFKYVNFLAFFPLLESSYTGETGAKEILSECWGIKLGLNPEVRLGVKKKKKEIWCFG